MSINVVSSRIAHAAVLCAFAGALLSHPVASQAASKTLTISGTPATTVAVGGHYSFQPTAKDTVKSRIKFNIYNKPDWATFDGTTGKLSGSPHRFDTGTYKNITIRLTDWYGFVTTVPFSITVTRAVTGPVSAPSSSAPTTSGSTTTAGNTTTSGKTTTASKPATPVNTTTSGGSTSASTGSTHSGSAPSAPATSTQAFTSGSVTLDWAPSTENTDGSVMTNLAGYTVHYGTDRTKLTQTIKVSNAGVATFVVDNLAAGTWYFSATSFNSQGIESSNSGVISTTVL